MAPTISNLFIAEVATADPEASKESSLLEPNTLQQKSSLQKPTLTQTTEKKVAQIGSYKWDIVWRNVLGMIYLHLFSLYGLYLFFMVCQWKTFFWTVFIMVTSGFGITAGAHRLWAHRCYKAKLPMRLILAFWQTMAFQNHIYEWVRDHRVHHKFTDSDADPHNAKRGFFFSHVGWLLVKKHKDISIKGKSVDLSDLLEDPIVRFQRRFYLILMPICCFAIPTLVPYYFWNEDLFTSWYVCAITRYTFTLNSTWLVNSAAHIYGLKPYDKSIQSTENRFVSIMAIGEGWHNYHHVFPWDYKASEFGYKNNWTTSFIDMCAKIGWAYDLKTVSQELIEKRVSRTGDGSRLSASNSGQIQTVDLEGPEIWGWGDKDISLEHVKYAQISNKLKNV